MTEGEDTYVFEVVGSGEIGLNGEVVETCRHQMQRIIVMVTMTWGQIETCKAHINKNWYRI